VASLLFTAIHWPYWLYSQGWSVGLLVTSAQIFLLALLLGYLVKKTESLWPSILTHLLNNLLSSLVHIV
jgi:membrane protease YdiL (CAAX protease family)